MRNLKNISFILIVLIIISGCRKEDEPVVVYHEEAGVFICNEGNFTYGNGTLSFYDPESRGIANQIFYNANSFPLGDVVQSMNILNAKGFLVVNNSGKIMVINVDDFTHIATITGLTSPRYIEFISDSKAYVTDLYNTAITIINPSTYEITGQIDVGRSTEDILVFNDHAYVTSWSGNKMVYKINTSTDLIVDSLVVTLQPNSIALDNQNRLWVLSDGSFPGSSYGQDTATLTCIHTDNFEIIHTIKLDNLDVSPTDLKVNNTGDTLFFINGSWSGSSSEYGIYKLSVNDIELPNAAFIPEDGKLFYALDIHPQSSDIYVSDAIDFSRKGGVYRYNPTGVLLDSFDVDIAPGAFCFKP